MQRIRKNINDTPKFRIEYMSVKEYAALKKLHEMTVRRKIDAGIIKAEQDGEGCAIRIPVKFPVYFF